MQGYMISVTVLFIILTLVSGRRVQNPCEDDKIPCDDGECISQEYWCDDWDDCRDKSDAKYCQNFPISYVGSGNNCTDIHFECEDRMCIPVSLRCDGTPHCKDSSDEKNCETIDREETTRSTKASVPDHYTTPKPYYKSREDESYNPPPIVYNNNYNNSYAIPNPNSHPRGSDTLPGGNFPNNQQPHVPPTTTTRTRTRPGPSRSGYPIIEREKTVIFPPRSISYVPQHSRSSNYPRRNIKTPNYSHFYFDKNYTRDTAYDYKTNIQNAKKWLLSKRNSFYGWDRDTPRALIALSLISNSFQSDVEDNELLRKSLQTHLGVKLLRNNTGIEQMSTTRLAMYINALLATCQDPRDFLGIDLAEILYYRQSHLGQDQKFVNPLIYLSLCLTDIPVNVGYLQTFLTSSLSAEISKDLHILATTAMACVAQQNPTDRYIRSILEAAARNISDHINPSDGSFGSKYSTALAAQVLMSVNASLRWNFRKTLDYLANQQEEDGSFGDMQSTYYTLIALSGRSLLHVRNTLCDTAADIRKESSGCLPDDIMNRDGPRKSILYTLRVDYPESFSAGLRLSVPADANFYEIMCIAAHQDRRYKYNYKITHSQLGIHTIANLPNDPERGKFWNLYWLPTSADTLDLRSRYPGDIRRLIPNDGDEMIFWYLNDMDI